MMAVLTSHVTTHTYPVHYSQAGDVRRHAHVRACEEDVMSVWAGSFFVPGTMASHGVNLVGILCLLGVSLVIARLTEARPATHVQLLWVRLDVLDGLASGLVVGLASGLAGAMEIRRGSW